MSVQVYQPCILQTKKRYVGFMYETPDQKEPVFDAKGIETVRRDNCGVVSKVGIIQFAFLIRSQLFLFPKLTKESLKFSVSLYRGVAFLTDLDTLHIMSNYCLRRNNQMPLEMRLTMTHLLLSDMPFKYGQIENS